jgi:membrane protease subunit HflK
MYRQEEPEINLDQLLKRIGSFFGRLGIGGGGGAFVYLTLGILLLALLIWLGTGFYTVQPGERAVLRRFGKYDSTQGPGLHWFPPSPVGTRSKVRVDEVRRLEVGFRGNTPVLTESLMITGNENIVDVQLLVQFDVKDPVDFLFRAVDPDGITIKNAAESALRQVVGKRNIDDVLTTEKEAVQAEAHTVLQGLLDTYQTGIQVREVQLLNVNPPRQVQDAFDDVVRAREDKERIINLAQAYQADILPRAQGEASRMRAEAQAFREQRIAKATGEAERFLSILREFKKAEDVTRQRLYLEAMEEILPGVTKFIVATEGSGSLLQLLPLSGGVPVPSAATAGTTPQASGTTQR